uniref:Uncharacterized protein n=1 Tax=Oryza rufipogon TaxID=4529 RepID=A0A0E0PKC1_ORYRU
MGEKEAMLVVCANDVGLVYDINTCEKIMYIHDCVAPPCGLAFVDGFLLAASRTDKDQPIFGSAIYFWAPSKIKEVQKSYVAEAIGPIACSKDGVYLVGGASSGHTYIWEDATLIINWFAPFVNVSLDDLNKEVHVTDKRKKVYDHGS